MTAPADPVLRDSLKSVLAQADDHDSIAAALADQGWYDIAAADGDPAWQVLFEECAITLSPAHPLDLLLEPVLGRDARVTHLIYATERTAAQQAMDARLGREPYPRGITRASRHVADRYVVLTARSRGCVTAAEADADQVSLEPVQGLDPDLRLRLAQLHTSPQTIAEGGLAAEFNRAQVLQSWALHALSERMLAIAIEHVRVRHQFGRPVGSFQAVKHLLADCAVELESLRAVLAYASQSPEPELEPDPKPEPDPVAVTAARAMAGRTSLLIGQAARQVTGAMGFSWEFPLHRYIRRAHSYDLMLGPCELHTRHLGQLILDLSAAPRLGEA
jgi:Acyl-CoA dehydrogenase, C-terminal domain